MCDLKGVRDLAKKNRTKKEEQSEKVEADIVVCFGVSSAAVPTGFSSRLANCANYPRQLF